MSESPFHPVAEIFPMMDEAALTELSADIAANGLREPIWRHQDGRIVDGRNRWLACQNAFVEGRQLNRVSSGIKPTTDANFPTISKGK